MQFNKRIKYSENLCKSTLELVDTGLSIESVAKKLNIPSTTIGNWKYGYTKIYGSFDKLDVGKRDKVLNLASKDIKIKDIAKEVGVGYNSVRIFLKKTLDEEKYEKIKITQHKLPKNAKQLTWKLSYIFGVMIGDGYFADCQLRLDVIDKEFRDYFSKIVEGWGGKSAREREFVNGKSYFYQSILHSKEACEFIKFLKEGKINFIDKILALGNDDIKAYFIKGFSDSEGTIAKDHRLIRIYNIDKELLEKIKEVLIDLGFDENKMHIRLSTKVTYELGIKSHKNIELFYQKIGFTIKRKQKRLENFVYKKGDRRDLNSVWEIHSLQC